jgi:Ca2+-binding EF-hand superfamily protein
MIWKNYDVDGNGILDMMEAWRFIKENMSGQTSYASFNTEWACMDTDGSGGLSKHELACYI